MLPVAINTHVDRLRLLGTTWVQLFFYSSDGARDWALQWLTIASMDGDHLGPLSLWRISGPIIKTAEGRCSLSGGHDCLHGFRAVLYGTWPWWWVYVEEEDGYRKVYYSHVLTLMLSVGWFDSVSINTGLTFCKSQKWGSELISIADADRSASATCCRAAIHDPISIIGFLNSKIKYINQTFLLSKPS